MSLLDEARAQSRHPGPLCSVQKAIAANPDLADEIADLLRADDVTHVAAADTFRRRSIRITHYTVQRHRDNKCQTCMDFGVTW